VFELNIHTITVIIHHRYILIYCYLLKDYINSVIILIFSSHNRLHTYVRFQTYVRVVSGEICTPPECPALHSRRRRFASVASPPHTAVLYVRYKPLTLKTCQSEYRSWVSNCFEGNAVAESTERELYHCATECSNDIILYYYELIMLLYSHEWIGCILCNLLCGGL
jgi:hypothetical protein